MFIRSLFIALAIGLAAGATTAHARPQAQGPACRVSLAAAEAVTLMQSLDTVEAALGCPGSVRSIEVLSEDLAFQTRVWMLDVLPYGEFRGEFINGQLHGMTKAWLDLSWKLSL